MSPTATFDFATGVAKQEHGVPSFLAQLESSSVGYELVLAQDAGGGGKARQPSFLRDFPFDLTDSDPTRPRGLSTFLHDFTPSSSIDTTDTGHLATCVTMQHDGASAPPPPIPRPTPPHLRHRNRRPSRGGKGPPKPPPLNITATRSSGALPTPAMTPAITSTTAEGFVPDMGPPSAVDKLQSAGYKVSAPVPVSGDARKHMSTHKQSAHRPEPRSTWTNAPLKDSKLISPASVHGNDRSARNKASRPPRSAWAEKKEIHRAAPKIPRKAAWEFSASSSSRGWGNNDEDPGLKDFDGGWAPAPPDWDNRPGFRNGQSADKIFAWIAATNEALDSVPESRVILLMDGLTTLLNEIAPRYWVPSKIDGQSPKLFWSALAQATNVKPIDEDDLTNHEPFWSMYPEERGAFLAEHTHPVVDGPDPDENESERLARENDLGGNRIAEAKLATEKAKLDARRARKAQKDAQRRQALELKGLSPTGPPPIQTVPNLLVRIATVQDAAAISKIYNQSVDYTCVVPEITHRTKEQFEQRIRSSKTARLPFIIAYEQGKRIKAPKKGRHQNYNDGEDVVLPDEIHGFAFADEYGESDGIYRFTAMAEVYVDVNRQGKKVGSCLLDKLLGLLDPTYVERSGYVTMGELDGAGPQRNIRSIVVHYPYQLEQRERMEGICAWLARIADFKKMAELEGIAEKDGKELNLAILQKRTGASREPSTPTPVTQPNGGAAQASNW